MTVHEISVTDNIQATLRHFSYSLSWLSILFLINKSFNIPKRFIASLAVPIIPIKAELLPVAFPQVTVNNVGSVSIVAENGKQPVD